MSSTILPLSVITTDGRYKYYNRQSYYNRGLSVIATACDGSGTCGAQPSWHYRQGRCRVVTAFWTHEYADGPAAYEQQQALDRGKREKHCTMKRDQAKAAYEKRSAAYEKQQAFDRGKHCTTKRDQVKRSAEGHRNNPGLLSWGQEEKRKSSLAAKGIRQMDTMEDGDDVSW